MKNSSILGLIALALTVGLSAQLAFAVSTTQFSQVIGEGTLNVDIVDANGVAVANPAVTFSALSFSFDSQPSTGVLGTENERVRLSNGTLTAPWTVSIAATGGANAGWSDGAGNTFDFNDSAVAADGGDIDTVGGQLAIDPSVGTLAPIAPFDATGVSKGSNSSFVEGISDSITLMSADGSAVAPGRWDLTGAGLTQTIPGGQNPGTYTMDMTLTAV